MRFQEFKKQYLAELLSTFILVFCGTGAIVINQETNGAVSHVGISITFGLVVTAMIYSFGHISGAHMNPAVTLVALVKGDFNIQKFAGYLLFQTLGAISASLSLKLLFPTNEFLGSTLPSGSLIQSFILEYILTFILVIVIIKSTEKQNSNASFAGFVIGGTVLLEALFAGPICGASMNPVRSLAPAVVSGHLEYLWLYISSTCMGALSAYFISK